MSERPATLPTASAVLFAVAALIDLSYQPMIGSKDAAPLPVMLLVAACGVGTLVALLAARRGSRPAVIVAVVLRVIPALLAFVAFFTGAPVWVMALSGAEIAATAAGLLLLRRRPAVVRPA